MKNVVFVFVGWLYQWGINGGGVRDSKRVVCYFCVLFGNQVTVVSGSMTAEIVS